ncbi:MAG: hypothetical protein DME32_04145, partial [Verrucomicrobia bacterium]
HNCSPAVTSWQSIRLKLDGAARPPHTPSMPRPRWNFSSRASELSDGDVVILSVPKSGRTWLRTFLSAYFSHKVGRQFAVSITDRHTPEIPRIVFSHDRFEHLTKGSAWDRLRGKYLVPAGQIFRAPVVLLVRDPRDAFVSYFLQLTRRNPPTPDTIAVTTTDALLRDRRFGITAMVKTMNTWLKEFGSRPDFHLVRYEDLRADTESTFRNVLDALGEKAIITAAFEQALSFSSFDNMQRLEASGGFRTKILQPRDCDDPETFKVRKGSVGAYKEYLSRESQEFATQACAKLDPVFGYRI